MMSDNNANILISFVVYLVGMMAIGWFFYRKTRNLTDYILGGRGLNSWVTSMSAQASDMSGWLLLGLPGYAYLAGFEAFWIAIGLCVGTYLNWKFVARRLRKYTEIAGNSITIPDYFENRFHDQSNVLRIVSAFFILVFFLIYTSSGFVAGAKLFSTVFELPYTMGLLIGALVIISYTFLGGFSAVSWTDFIQGAIMFFAVLIVPIVGIHAIGGFSQFNQAILDINPELFNIFTDANGNGLSWIAVISLLAWGLGYFGQPHILARFMAIRSSSQIKQARHIAMVWVVISLACAVFIGIVGRVYLKTFLEGNTSETVFMELVSALVHPLPAGILLAAILAAIMSTADSQLLVTSSAITQDFYKVLIRKNASGKELLWVGRLAVVLVAAAAFVIALDPGSSVLGLVAYAWGGFGAAFGPLILISLFWKRMTRNGAIAGIVIGGVTVLVWKQLHGGIFDVYEIVPGFTLSVVTIFLVSLLDHPPDTVIITEFESVKTSDI